MKPDELNLAVFDCIASTTGVEESIKTKAGLAGLKWLYTKY